MVDEKEKSDEVGAIHLIAYADGKVDFSLTGIFQKHPELLADLLEEVQVATS